MDDIQCVESFEATWPSLPKNEVLTFEPRNRARARLGFACQVADVQVIAIIVIGARGGLTEELFAIDTTQHIVADRFLFADSNRMEPHLFDLTSLRRVIRKGHEDAVATCTACLEVKLQDMQSAPVSYAGYLQRCSFDRGVSVGNAMSGGAFSLGKRA